MTIKQRNNPAIPRGWHRLRLGTIIRLGDYFWCVNQWDVSWCPGYVIGDPETLDRGEPMKYIRRNAR